MKRRDFIKTTGTGWILWTLPMQSPAYSPDEKRLAVIRKLCRVVVPVDENIPVDPESINLPHKVDMFINSQLFFVKELLKTAIKVVEILPYFKMKFKKFSSLSDEEAEEIFLSLRRSRFPAVKGIYLGLKSIINFFYYSSEEVWKHIGYEGPLLKGVEE